MKIHITITIMLLLAILSSSCSITNNTLTRSSQYPKMYQEKPTSILIAPPINETNFPEAKDQIYTTLYSPLVQKGYYVIPPFLAMDLLQQESAYDSEVYIEGNLKPFGEIFGADAVLFTVIRRWEKASALAKISADVEYILRSTSTGEELFRRRADITLDYSVSVQGGGLTGFLVGLVASTVVTASMDKIQAARICNEHVLKDLPEGNYSPRFAKDGAITAGHQLLRGVVKK